MEPLFVVAKKIGSPDKNDLPFHSIFFWVWLWPLQNF